MEKFHAFEHELILGRKMFTVFLYRDLYHLIYSLGVCVCVSNPNSSTETEVADTIAYILPCETKNVYICNH